jgi:hypothetical protein
MLQQLMKISNKQHYITYPRKVVILAKDLTKMNFFAKNNHL